MKAPFVQPGLSGPVTVDGITYPEGTYDVPFFSGMKYQYNLTMREFWRVGLGRIREIFKQRIGQKL